MLCAVFYCMSLLAFSPMARAGESLEYDGLIESRMVVEVGSAVPGILETVNAERGDMVKKHQVLATIHSGVERATMELARVRAELETNIRSRQEELDFAKRNVERNRDLYEKKAIPFYKWDEIETQLMLAQFRLSEAYENKRLAELEYRQSVEVVERKTIRSPLTGVVVERFLHPGEYVEDNAVFELAQINPLHVEVVLPVKMLGTVKEGMRAKVKPESPVNGSYMATVTVVDRVVDAASGTFGVRLKLPNPDFKLPPGLKCKVIFP